MDIAKEDVCKFYMEGRCRFGGDCRNQHPADISVLSSAKKPKKKKQKSSEKPGKRLESDESKLPPMKTSRDVIRRIQWDDEFPSDNITIGYLDRFVGVVEQRFDAFDWNSDIASVDSETTLAIPQHRIQYFKYRGRKIWDKNERLDMIFGSTTTDKEDIATLLETIDDELIFQEDALCQTEPKMEDSGDKEPTHFLAIRIDNPEAISELNSTVSHLLSDQVCRGRVPTSQYHVTLNLLCLDTLDQVSSCIGLLSCIAPDFLTIDLKGIGKFKERILFAKVRGSSELANLADSLQSYLKSNGVRVVERPKEFHVTLVKGHKHVASVGDESVELRHFGEQQVDHVYLCALREAPDADGFYRVLATTLKTRRVTQ